MSTERKDRVAIPIECGATFDAERHWGGDSGPVEEWFNSGEELEHELTVEEAERWERAVADALWRTALDRQGKKPPVA
jgi:hypothetical protein